MNKIGFTLIELLVVVMIIGVLSAIALPQYKRTVERSRAAEAFVLGRHLAQAEELYYLSNGEYTNDWSLIAEEQPSSAFFQYVLDSSAYNIRISRIDGGYHLRFFMQHVSSPYAGKYLCVARASSKVGTDVCRSMSGFDTGEAYIHMGEDFLFYPLN